MPALEPDFKAELELALLVPRRVRKLIRIGRDRRTRIPESVDDGVRRDAGELLGVEHVLELGDYFDARVAANRDPPRVAKVDVLARREVKRVARDEQRTIAGDAVAVQVAVGWTVHRQ